MDSNTSEHLITDIDIREYFRDSVCTAVANQQLTVTEETIIYVVNMLASFTRSESLFERTADGYVIKALAMIYVDTIDAESTLEKNRVLQRLGDIALFISGIFSDSLNRSPVDVDYYAAMGGIAYAHLADSTRNSIYGRTLSMVFAELSDKFMSLVDVLSEISESSDMNSDSDVLRMYELWLKTGNSRLAKKLRQIGIQPVPVTANRQ
jgi:hypothetical protein